MNEQNNRIPKEQGINKSFAGVQGVPTGVGAAHRAFQKSPLVAEGKKTKKPGLKQPSRIDFTQLPMGRVSAMLERIGAELLERLLAGEQPPVLSTLLTASEKQTLARLSTWKVFRHRPFRRFGKNMRSSLPHAMDRMLMKFLFSRSRFSYQTWRKALGDRIALALGGTAGDGLPDALWQLVGERAWKSPGFRNITGQRALGYLRERELFMPFALPVVSFSPRTFWLLIALSPTLQSGPGQLFSSKRRAAVRLEQRLRREAWDQVMEDHWAGFWDQWLIRLTMERWHESFRFLDKRVCRAFMQLPFRFTGALHCDDCTSPPPRRPGSPGNSGSVWTGFTGCASPGWTAAGSGIIVLPNPAGKNRCPRFLFPGV